MVEMGRFVKPILGMLPADPTSLVAAGLKQLLGLLNRFRQLSAAGPVQPGPADDDERGRLSRSVVRDRRAQGDDVGVRDHRHVPRRAIAWHGLRPAAPLHGRNRRRVPVVGSRARRHRRHLERHRRRRAGGRRRDPHAGAGRRILVRDNKAEGVVLENGDEIRATVVASSVDPRLTFLRFLEPGTLPDDFVADIRRYKFRGSSAKVNLALDALPGLHRAARRRPAPARRHLDLAERGLHGTRLRRCEVRTVFAAPVHGHRHPVA